MSIDELVKDKALAYSLRVPVEQCVHKYVRIERPQSDGEGGSIPLYTCFHPRAVHCGGTFSDSIKREDYRFSFRQDGVVYLRRKEAGQ